MKTLAILLIFTALAAAVRQNWKKEAEKIVAERNPSSKKEPGYMAVSVHEGAACEGAAFSSYHFLLEAACSNDEYNCTVIEVDGEEYSLSVSCTDEFVAGSGFGLLAYASSDSDCEGEVLYAQYVESGGCTASINETLAIVGMASVTCSTDGSTFDYAIYDGVECDGNPTEEETDHKTGCDGASTKYVCPVPEESPASLVVPAVGVFVVALFA